MQPQQIVRDFRETTSRYGARAALHDLQCRLVNRVVRFDVFRVMRISLSDLPGADMFEAPGLDARFLSPAELAEAAREGAHDLTLEFVRRALERGDRCHGVFDGGVLASYGWYAAQPTAIDEHHRLHFDPAYTYMFKGYTLPAYRGNRLHAIGMCHALRAFSDEGKAGLISCVASNNFASLRSVARMGYRIFGNLYLARVGKHALAFASAGCRPFGVRATVTATAEAAPTIDATAPYQRLSWASSPRG